MENSDVLVECVLNSLRFDKAESGKSYCVFILGGFTRKQQFERKRSRRYESSLAFVARGSGLIVE